MDEEDELTLLGKLTELFGLIVEALPWKFILIGIPAIGLLVALLVPGVLG